MPGFDPEPTLMLTRSNKQQQTFASAHDAGDRRRLMSCRALAQCLLVGLGVSGLAHPGEVLRLTSLRGLGGDRATAPPAAPMASMLTEMWRAIQGDSMVLRRNRSPGATMAGLFAPLLAAEQSTGGVS